MAVHPQNVSAVTLDCSAAAKLRLQQLLTVTACCVQYLQTHLTPGVPMSVGKYTSTMRLDPAQRSLDCQHFSGHSMPPMGITHRS